MREGLASVADERTFFPVADIGQCEECLPQPFLMLQSILRACGGQLQNKKNASPIGCSRSYVMRPIPILMCCSILAVPRPSFVYFFFGRL